MLQPWQVVLAATVDMRLDACSRMIQHAIVTGDDNKAERLRAIDDHKYAERIAVRTRP